MIRFGTVTALFALSVGAAHAKEVPYTLEDRDRLIRVETSLNEFKQSIDNRFEAVDNRFEAVNSRIDELKQSVDSRFEAIEKRMDRLENRMDRLDDTMRWGFGLLFTSMIGLVGFVLWDRRTALAPAVRRSTELESREEKLEAAIRDFAAKSPQMTDSLKKAGLLR